MKTWFFSLTVAALSMTLVPITRAAIEQQAYLKASNTDVGDIFGRVVAISGDTMVVGAYRENSKSKGVNGDQSDNSINDTGAAYVFVRSGSVWTQQAYLKASNPGEDDIFGISVAIDGDTIVIGAMSEGSNAKGVNGNQNNDAAGESGAAYVFFRSGGVWKQQAYLKASNTGGGDSFGRSVSISGNTIVVGAHFEDGSSSGVNGVDNDSATDAGAAYVFTRTGSSWKQQAYLKAVNPGAGDQFGFSVSVSEDTIAVGAFEESSDSTGVNGAINEGAPSSGAVYVFTRTGTTWSQQAFVKASNTDDDDYFGWSVAVDGDLMVVGAIHEDSLSPAGLDEAAPDSGAAYAFRRQGGVWRQDAIFKSPFTGGGDEYGASVGISGQLVVVGANQEDSSTTGINTTANDSAADSGAAYVQVANPLALTGWEFLAYLKASNAEAGDIFGRSVGVSYNTVVVGAGGEDSAATGVNGAQSDNGSLGSGAAYAFTGFLQPRDSVARTATAAPGAVDVSYGGFGSTAIGPAGQVLFDGTLAGAGASKGRSKAMFSTAGGVLELALQSGMDMGGILGLPIGTKVTALSQPLANNLTSRCGFLATVTGNHTMVFRDNGSFITPLFRTGTPFGPLGGATMASLQDVVLFDSLFGEMWVRYKLQLVSGVTAAQDSGIFECTFDSNAIARTNLREGQPCTGSGGGTFGEFGQLSLNGGGLAPFIGTRLLGANSITQACFEVYNGTSTLETGVTVPGSTTNGERFRTFLGIGGGMVGIFNKSIFRTTLTNSPAATNEGVWDISNTLRFRKGDDIGGGVKIARFLRVWGAHSGNVMFLVQLTGTGVNAGNNVALIENKGTPVLLRTGSPVPGTGAFNAVASSIQAVDMEPTSSRYVVQVGLRGSSSGTNQCLLSGELNLGDDTTNAYLRLPKLLLRKGQRYSTTATPLGTIKGIKINPTLSTTGMESRGQRTVINKDGVILVEITTDRNVKELVRVKALY